MIATLNIISVDIQSSLGIHWGLVPGPPRIPKFVDSQFLYLKRHRGSTLPISGSCIHSTASIHHSTVSICDLLNLQMQTPWIWRASCTFKKFRGYSLHGFFFFFFSNPEAKAHPSRSRLNLTSSSMLPSTAPCQLYCFLHC